MQIYVCVKHVPDSAAHITIVDKTHIDKNLAFLLNPYDEYGLTEAVRIKNSLEKAEIIAVCLGREDAGTSLQSALAMGADRAILIVSDQDHDSIETANALKTAIEQDGAPGLIFTGKESIDSEGMQTMFRIGALFDFPVATNVVKLDIESGKAVVKSELSGGTANTYEMSMPCVIGAERGLNTPAYPTFPDIVKARKKPVKKINFTDLNIQPSTASMEIVELKPLQQTRKPEEIHGNPGEIARKIMAILKNEAKVI